MKALTLTEPWAALVASGAKRIETRSWRTSYRGPLAIHAAKAFPADARALCAVEPFRWRLLVALSCTDNDAAIVAALPRGEVIGITWIEDCVPVEEVDPGDEERAFGNYLPGRWAWKLREPLDFRAVPYRGALGLWDLPDEIVPDRYRLAIRHPGL